MRTRFESVTMHIHLLQFERTRVKSRREGRSRCRGGWLNSSDTLECGEGQAWGRDEEEKGKGKGAEKGARRDRRSGLGRRRVGGTEGRGLDCPEDKGENSHGCKGSQTKGGCGKERRRGAVLLLLLGWRMSPKAERQRHIRPGGPGHASSRLDSTARSPFVWLGRWSWALPLMTTTSVLRG